MSKEKSQEEQKELTLEIAFNNLVGVAREMKLSHNEHILLERSVQKVLEGLQGSIAQAQEEEGQEAPQLPAATSKKSRKRVKS